MDVWDMAFRFPKLSRPDDRACGHAEKGIDVIGHA